MLLHRQSKLIRSSDRPLVLRARHPRRVTTRVQSGTDSASEQAPPPGCSRYKVQLKKPLGVVLEQKGSGFIYVAEVVPEGSAAKTGLVQVGDQLIATSGVTYSRAEDYGGVRVVKGQEVVRVSALSETFATVRAAIGSHPGSMEVTLELQRCDTPLPATS